MEHFCKWISHCNLIQILNNIKCMISHCVNDHPWNTWTHSNTRQTNYRLRWHMWLENICHCWNVCINRTFNNVWILGTNKSKYMILYVPELSLIRVLPTFEWKTF
jgi:lipopolysaccharide biosynthesis glycosyltransferase